MQIQDVRTHLLSVPYEEPPKTGFLTLEKLDLLVVEVETTSGVIGTGHLHPLAGGMRTLEMCIHEMLVPRLSGRSIEDIPTIWWDLWESNFIQGRMGITVMAQSAIDIALWDALGRERGEPLWKLWGGSDEPLPAYGSGCYRGLGHDGMIEKAKRYVDRGFSAIKMQVAHVFTDEEDIVNVRDMREALGSEVHIMVDVNQGWSVEQAVRVGRQLDEFELAWLEEPVIADDFDGYKTIAESLRTPIVGGENHFTHKDMEPFFQGRHVPILQPDIMRGGYTDLMETATRSHQAGLRIAPHLFPELTTHLNASIPNAAWLEYMGWYDHLWVEPIVPKNGTMTPPDRPGHGMDFRPELFSEFAYER